MIERKHWHPDLTDARVVDAAERHMFTLDDPGLCISCGHEQGGCEPDARHIRCESCGARQVYGAEELVMHLDAVPVFRKILPIWPAGRAEGD